MTPFKRINRKDKYYTIEIFECPTALIVFAANLGSENVTVENYTHYGDKSLPVIQINGDEQTIKPLLKRYDIDFQINKQDFKNLASIWHVKGCYAIFHASNELKLKATNLDDNARYKALDNFNWTLELAIPGSASDGWGAITSPDKSIIDSIEEYLTNL
ncbi:MAG: hypothetical protein V4620_01850 [Bacteroidota bacterium]